MAQLTIHLLGAPQIITPAGEALQLPRRQPLALLALLALHPDGLSRDQLSLYLWPDAPQDIVRQRLRRTLSQLRQALGPHKSLIQSSGNHLALAPAGYQIDAHQFSHLATQASQTSGPAAIQACEQALNHYAGPLLDGFYLEDSLEFEQWLTIERTHLEQRYRHLLQILIEQLILANAYERAIVIAERLLALDSLAEEVHAQLMRLYAVTNRREAALRQYQRCAQLLADELGITPLPETTALHQTLLRGENVPVMATAAPTATLPPTNLPAQLNRLIGRETEVALVGDLLRQPDIRLITLTGPGGTGKTRLALQVAAEMQPHFADGVYFVDLSPLADPNLVATTLAGVLKIDEAAGEPLPEQLIDALHTRQLLLVLDNFEQLLPAGKLIAQLLQTCPQLKVLATSRAVLQIYGEREYPVPPLALPDPGRGADPTITQPPTDLVAAIAQFPAVTLFAERAQAVRPDFLLTPQNILYVTEICRRLDGLPLAIELAAARSNLLTPQAMLARFTTHSGSRALTLLKSRHQDRPPRQQTLWDAIEWSYNLLNEPEQRLFARLGVFVDGCTLAAAEQVAGHPAGDDLLDSLTALVNHSMIRQQADSQTGQPRFQMLVTIREYALSQLDVHGELPTRQAAHAACYLTLAEEARPHLRGPQQVSWLNQLDQEHDNLRAALHWAIDNRHPETALRLGQALWLFWVFRGHQTEGRHWLQQILSLPTPAANPAQDSRRAAVYHGAGIMAHQQRDYHHAQQMLTQALALYRSLDDRPGMAGITNLLGTVNYEQGALDLAQEQYEAALSQFRALNETRMIAVCLNNLGRVAHVRDELAQANHYFAESLALLRQIEDTSSIAVPLNNLAVVSHDIGDSQQALQLLTESLALRRKVGDRRGISNGLVNLGNVHFDLQNMRAANDCYREGLELAQQVGDKAAIACCLEGLAGIAGHAGRARLAAQLCGSAEHTREKIGSAILYPADRRRYQAITTTIQAQLTTPAWHENRARGQALPLEQIVALALAWHYSAPNTPATSPTAPSPPPAK